MNRRSFLNRAFIALGLLLGGWGVQRLVTGNAPPALDEEQAARIASILRPLFAGRGARGLGDAYLQRAPDESDPEVLLGRLCADWTPEELAADAEAITARVRRQHREDFTAGRTVDVDGWIVSVTEARVAALARAS